jgi:hypothetical protein
MTLKEKQRGYKQLSIIIGHRYNIKNIFNDIEEIIKVCFGTSGEVGLYDVPNEERLTDEDYRIDFSWGEDVSGSIWYLKTNSPFHIYITEVELD